MVFAYDPDIVYRDFVTHGVPTTNRHEPRKSDIRALFAERDAVLGSSLASGSLIFDTRANLYASLAHAADTQAWVVQDGSAAYNGIYRKAGGSGSGSWSRVADLPYSFAHMSDVGAGTADAIQVTSSIPTSGSMIRVANVFEANTGPVTIAENGGAAKALKTNSGNDLAAGSLIAGGMIVYVDDGTNFRLLSDQASAAILAGAEAAQLAAEAAQEAAENAAASVNLPAISSGDAGKALVVNEAEDGYELGTASGGTAGQLEFATKADAEASNPSADPDFIRLAGYSAAGDGGGALYKKAASEPSHAGKFQNANGTWYELTETRVSPLMFDAADVTNGANLAAEYILAKGRGTLDLSDRTWTFTDRIYLDASYMTVDARNATITCDHNAGACFQLGNGTTLRNRIEIVGGRWSQVDTCLQYLFSIRYVRNVVMTNIQGSNLFHYLQWGSTTDTAASYKLYESDLEINLRWPTVGTGHGNCHVVPNSAGGWYQSNCTFEGRSNADNDAIRTSYAIVFTGFVPTRLDHWMASNVIYKGFTYGIYGSTTRLVNLQWASMRVDDCRNTPYMLNNIDGLEGSLWAGGLTLQTGVTFSFAANGSGNTIANVNADLHVDRATATLCEISGKTSGTVNCVNVRLVAPDWRPTSVNDCAILLNQGTSGSVDLITVAATVKVNSAATATPTRGLALFNTVTNVVKGAVNVVGCTNVANF